MARRKTAMVHEPVGEENFGLERWRGTVDEKLRNIDKSVVEVKETVRANVFELKESIVALGERIVTQLTEVDRCGKKEHEHFDARISLLEDEYARTKARIALFAGIAGIIGGGLSSAAWGTVFHKIFG